MERSCRHPLITPAPGTTLTGSTVTFGWNPGNSASHFQLAIGSTGVGASNIYSSGSVTATSEKVTGLPTNGEKLYVELSWEIGTTWYSASYTFTAYGSVALPAITTPAPSSKLTGTSVTFDWTKGAGGETHYELYLGTTGVGSNNLYNSGSVTTTSEKVSGLPSNGETIYAKLYWEIGTVWSSTNYTFTAYGSVTPPAMTSPASGSTFASTSQAFTWTPGNTATQFKLYLGTTPLGSTLYNYGNYNRTYSNRDRAANQWRNDLRHSLLPRQRYLELRQLHLQGEVTNPGTQQNLVLGLFTIASFIFGI